MSTESTQGGIDQQPTLEEQLADRTTVEKGNTLYRLSLWGTEDTIFESSKILLYALLMFAMIFHVFFLEKYNSFIVEGFIDSVAASPFMDLVIAGGSILVILWICNEYSSRRGRFKNLITVLVIFCIIHSFFRSQGINYYKYEKFTFLQSISCLKGIAYLDICYLLLLVLLIINLSEIYSYKRINYKEDPFFIDVPIKNSENDLLNRKRFAEQIANKIQSKPKEDDCGSLAIGVVGEWGSGKTSFCHMIEEKIDREERIVIKFNPWRSSSSEKIVEDFFKILIAELKVYDLRLSNNIYDYAQQLSDLDENLVTKVLKIISNPFTSKNELYDRINDSINSIGKQIIIFIDDLDRLSKPEIVEVLRIIRNTANFNNTVYVVSYDKDYVVEALKYYNESKHTTFLEKIFQFEFILPFFEPKLLRKYLVDLLVKNLGKEYEDELTAIVNHSTGSNTFTDRIIKTHRDAIRLSNAFIFEINDIKNDVNWYDFYLIQLLKFEFPREYNLIVNNLPQIFIHDEENHGYIRLKLVKEKIVFTMQMLNSNRQPQNNDQVDEKMTVLGQYLQRELKAELLQDEQLSFIESVIDELLFVGRQMNKQYKNQGRKYFANSNNFLRYFAFEMPENDIYFMDFEQIRRESFKEYSIQIDKWLEGGKYDALWELLKKVDVFDTKNEYENHVRALKKIGQYLYNTNQASQFDLSNLIDVMQKVFNKYKKELFLYTDLDEYKNFLRSIIEPESKNAILESDIVKELIDKGYNCPLDDNELSARSIGYLENYIGQSLPVDNNLYELFYNSRERIKDEYGSRIQPLAIELYVNYWKSHVHACSLATLIRHTTPDAKYFNLRVDSGTKLFNDFEELYTWFKQADNLKKDSDCYKEFNSFLELTKIKEYNSVEFEFKFLKPSLWR